ncbi:MAG: acyl-CoA synthetase [Pseudomonas sp.]|nr:acyl-CoA synthetase [Pseudomonas sp.]
MSTLPEALFRQAQLRGDAVALRAKRLGLWREQRWGEVAREVGHLAAGLQAQGFVAAQGLVIISQARSEALLLTLAVLWLGGRVTLLEPGASVPQLPRQVFVDSLEQLPALRRDGLVPTLLVYADGRGAAKGQGCVPIAYQALLADGPAPAINGTAHAQAFDFIDQHLSQQVVLDSAAHWIASEQLDHHHQALCARVLAASGQVRYLLGAWLLAGFTLNFPETLATRDQDRRELGPTLVAGTRESWGRLAAMAQERLPLPGSVAHGLYRWAVTPTQQPLRRWLGHWLIRRPLLDVLGLGRLQVPLLVGEPLAADTAQFFAGLGIHPRSAEPAKAGVGQVPTPAAYSIPSIA